MCITMLCSICICTVSQTKSCRMHTSARAPPRRPLHSERDDYDDDYYYDYY